MAKGRKCPKCGRMTLHKSYRGMFVCSNCGFSGR